MVMQMLLCLDSKSEECILICVNKSTAKQLCLDSKSEECILDALFGIHFQYFTTESRKRNSLTRA